MTQKKQCLLPEAFSSAKDLHDRQISQPQLNKKWGFATETNYGKT
jgi:hypothetical protein